MKQQEAQNYTIPLHDIKPIVDVQEYSLYYLIATVIFAIVVTSVIIYLIYKWLQKRKTFSIRKEHFGLMNSLDLNDTKSSAYAITTYGYTFKDDSPGHQEMYENLTNRLEVYKYKKEVDKFDSEVLGYIEVYKGMIDV